MPSMLSCHSRAALLHPLQAVAGEFHGTLQPSQLEAMSLNFEQWKYAW